MATVLIHFNEKEKALELRRKSNHIYESLNLRSQLASGYAWIGNIYKELGDFPKALENYFISLKISEEENHEQNLGYALVNISSIYRYQKQYEEAKEYALKALTYFKRTNDINGLAWTYYRLAMIYQENEDYESAFKNLNDAIFNFRSVNNSIGIATSSMFLGNLYQITAKNDSALFYYNAVLPVVLQMGDKANLAGIYQNIGNIYINIGEYFKAKEFYYKSFSVIKELNNKYMLMDLNYSFVQLYSRLNDSDSVYWYLYQYRQLSDSLYSEQNSRSIAEMQTRYETEKKDKEIIALNLENEKKKNDFLVVSSRNEIANLRLKESAAENERNIQSLKLAEAKREKQQAEIEIHKLKVADQTRTIQDEKLKKQRMIFYFLSGFGFLMVLILAGFLLFRNKKKREQAILKQKAAELNHELVESNMKALRSQMNPHFIFNCVQTIERMLNDTKIRESINALNQFSNLTRFVLENSTKREIPLADEIKILELYMDLENARFQVPFTYTFSIDPGIDPSVTMIPPLLLQPLVENSVKHGFHNNGKKGHLQIEIKEDNGLLACFIEDNGIGIKESQKMKSLSGFKKESLGIKLIEERFDLINRTKGTNCTFSLEDLEENGKPAGTRVKMLLPLEFAV
jgi:tetratricopeptide (TPR) repeat protein